MNEHEYSLIKDAHAKTHRPKVYEGTHPPLVLSQFLLASSSPILLVLRGIILGGGSSNKVRSQKWIMEAYECTLYTRNE